MVNSIMKKGAGFEKDPIVPISSMGNIYFFSKQAVWVVKSKIFGQKIAAGTKDIHIEFTKQFK